MADTNKTTNTPDLGDKPELGNGKDGSGSYQMRVGFGTIAMLISATGMGLVPLFSRWATRTDMFNGSVFTAKLFSRTTWLSKKCASPTPS